MCFIYLNIDINYDLIIWFFLYYYIVSYFFNLKFKINKNSSLGGVKYIIYYFFEGLCLMFYINVLLYVLEIVFEKMWESLEKLYLNIFFNGEMK